MVVVRFVLRVLGGCVGAVLLFGVALYLHSEWYSFTPGVPFSGNRLYNPYEGAALDRGFLANFHAHSACWGGLTNGKGTPEEVRNRYAALGYDFFAVSNYQRIDTTAAPGLHTYEHGWGVQKTHQLVIGGSEVTWLDFPYFQNEHQKQTLVHRIRRANPRAVLVAAHPALRGGYTAEDLALIEGFDAVEALSRMHRSVALWDEVLSSGTYLPTIGNDDCHDIFKQGETGRFGTYVLSGNPGADATLAALRSGRCFVVEFPVTKDTSAVAQRRLVTQPLPLESIHTGENFVEVVAKEPLAHFWAFTDNGDTLLHIQDQDTVRVLLPAHASYVRFQAQTQDGRTLYTNPIARTSGGKPQREGAARFDLGKTILYRSAAGIAWGCLAALFFRLLNGKRPHSFRPQMADRVPDRHRRPAPPRIVGA
jgi:hypothetical protein